MLIYEQFVFIHTPKTAGMFLREVFQEELPPPERELDTHSGWSAIPPEAAERPVLMFVRNPWDWYVSWYHYWALAHLPSQPPDAVRANPWARLLLGERFEVTDDGLRGVDDFAGVVRNACANLVPGHPVMAEMIAGGEPHARGVNAGDDFYTAQIKLLAGAGLDTGQLTIGRYESLFDDLGRFVSERDVPIAAGAMDRIRTRQPVNTQPHLPYREYYDDDLRDLVGRSCRMLIERFDYSF